MEILTLRSGHIGRDIRYRAIILLMCADALMAMLAIVQVLRWQIVVVLPVFLVR